MRLTDCGVLGSTTDALIICGHNRSTSARKNQTLKTIMTFFFFTHSLCVVIIYRCYSMYYLALCILFAPLCSLYCTFWAVFLVGDLIL